jgi:hypothetical protein
MAVAAEPMSSERANEASVEPVEWCERVLGTLRQRRTDDRETGHLEMLLTSFMEMQPPSHTFAALLARYVADSRPGIAAAAFSLQRAWESANQGAVPPPLPFEDLLRTLGSLLDEAGARAGYLSVGPAGATLQGCGPTPCQRTLGPLELHHENTGRSALRSQVSPAGEASPERFESRLRIVGAMLETQPVQGYEIIVGPHLIEVEGEDGYCHVFTAEEIAALISEAAEGRAPDQ